LSVPIAPDARLSRFFTDSAQATVLTIGNFDGVHLGHRALLARLTAAAAKAGLPAAVLTFEPHPREFFDPAIGAAAPVHAA
jgi:riboflavin kinase/FMN adenylyltransferase